jgi:gliding motility-associated-like protein
MQTRLLLITIFFVNISLGYAQSPVVKWKVKNPFEQKVFIENKGQYKIENKVVSKDILFGARQGGLQYYFTNNAIWIKREVAVNLTEEEIAQLQNQLEEKGAKEEEDKELNYKIEAQFHQINFMGANPSAEITSENEVSWYYNFTINGNVPVKARAYKKLTYRNLYPGIDMEFYFPQDTTGFEYSFIVHPGADVSQIKIKYPLNDGIQFIDGNNIVVKSQFGNFIDHAPVTSQQGKTIGCSFSLNNAIAGFIVSDYDKTQNLIIDPWTIIPKFTGLNDAYDVDWDNAGNCYIYGGTVPWQLIKYNSNGVMLWSFTEDFVAPITLYGDFAVDRNSQSVYVVDGIQPSSGAEIIKVNGSGAQVKIFSGNPNFYEMWRIAFNHCTNKAVIAGGGTSTPSFQACYLDTSLNNLSPVNILHTAECCHDEWGITLDNYGNCYTATSMAIKFPDSLSNLLLKLPLPSLTPATWTVNDGYKFAEASSTTFAFANFAGATNAFNGMTISNTDLFTYDSYVLKKWNSSTGAAVNSITVNIPVHDSLMYWSGLTSDDCDNIFLGSASIIKQYDGNLNFKASIQQPDTIYGLSLGKSNILYACGMGFVSATQLSLPACNNRITFSNKISNVNCPNPTGSAIVKPMGGVSSYSVSWNTTPQQTGDTATNLLAGNYIATIIDHPVSCTPDTVYDTVQIVNSSGKSNVIVNSPTLCSGNSAVLTATGATIYLWSPGTGLSATTGDTVTANPITTTTYTVIGVSSCPDTVRSIVTIIPTTLLTIKPPSPSVCDGQHVSLTVTGGTNYNWSPATGLSATTGDTVIVTPTASVKYTVTGMDSIGCPETGTDSVTFIVIPPLIIHPQSPSVCAGEKITLTAPLSGSGYSWSPALTLNSSTGDNVIATPSVTTTYTVTGTDSLGCTSKGTDSVIVTAAPPLIIHPQSPSVCLGQHITLSVTVNGSGYAWSPASTLISSTGDNVVATPSVTTTYTVTGIDSLGCNDSARVVLAVNPLPLITIVPPDSAICHGYSVRLTAGGASTYQWNPATGLNSATNSTVIANPSVTTIYRVNGTDSLGCIDSTNITITVIQNNIQVSPYNASVCQGNSLIISASGGTSYNWSPSIGLNKTSGDTVTAAPDSTTSYILIATGNGVCSDTEKVVVNVNLPPVLTVQPNAPEICDGQGIVLTASGASTYEWSPSTGLSQTIGSTVDAHPAVTSTYTVYGTDSSGCNDSTKFTLDLNSIPIDSFTSTAVSVCYPLQIQFSNTSSGAISYLWNFGDGVTSADQNPSHEFVKPGIYEVTLIAKSANGCTDTLSVADTITSYTANVYVSNSFTPLIPGVNQLFRPNIECTAATGYVFKVYDRWGMLLYETNNLTDGWDGTYKGKLQSLDTYVYYIQMTCGNCSFFKKGDVTLLK